MSKYTQRATIATPKHLMPEANQLALSLGESIADDKTFTTASYQDSDGNLYAVASTVVKLVFAEMAGQPLKAPNHSPDMDLAAATRAQSLLQINNGIATPDVIAVILGSNDGGAQEQIKALGLERMTQIDEVE
jgi:hypothetical protein